MSTTAVAEKKGALHWLDRNFENIFMVSGLLSIILFISWQVIYRYIITKFIDRAGAAVWTEELSRYIFIWISYMAVSVAIRKRSSIRVAAAAAEHQLDRRRISLSLPYGCHRMVRLGAD